MADTNKNGETDYTEASRLTISSEEFRKCSVAKNSPSVANEGWSGYVPGNEYCAGTPDTQSDGDNRGRDPEEDGGSIGTKDDIVMRNRLMAKNTPSVSDDGWSGYTPGSQYCAGSDRV